MTLNAAQRIALGCEIIFTKFDLQQLIHARIIAFYANMLCHAVTLTIDPLTLKVYGTTSVTWSKSVRNFSEIEQSSAESLIILRIFAHVMSPVTLTFDLLTLELLQHFVCHAFKLRTKFERNRIIRGWFYRRFSTSRRVILRVGHFYPAVLRGAWI